MSVFFLFAGVALVGFSVSLLAEVLAKVIDRWNEYKWDEHLRSPARGPVGDLAASDWVDLGAIPTQEIDDEQTTPQSSCLGG